MGGLPDQHVEAGVRRQPSQPAGDNSLRRSLARRQLCAMGGALLPQFCRGVRPLLHPCLPLTHRLHLVRQVALRSQVGVPVFLNQWTVHHGVTEAQVRRHDPHTPHWCMDGANSMCPLSSPCGPLHCVQGRFAFMADVAKELQRLDIGWAWWVWRGGGAPKYGSSGFVWGTGPQAGQDDQAISAVKPFI